jgi:hypothetical protein
VVCPSKFRHQGLQVVSQCLPEPLLVTRQSLPVWVAERKVLFRRDGKFPQEDVPAAESMKRLDTRIWDVSKLNPHLLRDAPDKRHLTKRGFIDGHVDHNTLVGSRSEQ